MKARKFCLALLITLAGGFAIQNYQINNLVTLSSYAEETATDYCKPESHSDCKSGATQVIYTGYELKSGNGNQEL